MVLIIQTYSARFRNKQLKYYFNIDPKIKEPSWLYAFLADMEKVQEKMK